MIIFAHIPKTAGTTFQFILENSFGMAHCHAGHAHRAFSRERVFTQADMDFARKVFPRLKSVSGHNLVDPLRLRVPEPFHLTFLRDPVSRMLSGFQEAAQLRHPSGLPMPGFEERWEKEEADANPMVRFLAGEENLTKAKNYLEQCAFVGLTEKFDLSLHVLGRLCPCKMNLNYMKRRVAADNSMRDELLADERRMNRWREKNRLDIELYGHAVAGVFPRLCRQAGLAPDAPVPSLNTLSSGLLWRRAVSRFYNQSVYRQLCKRRDRQRTRV